MERWKQRWRNTITNSTFEVWMTFDDDGFAYLMEKVKGVDMLDLNETDIGYASIQLLIGLEFVKEIRAKSCVTWMMIVCPS
jgi:hypothetical protein